MAGKESSDAVLSTCNRLRGRDCCAWSLLVSPNGDCPADHRGCGERSKVPTVERIRRLPVHDKDIAISNDAASLPGGKRAASPVAFVRLADNNAVDSDCQAVSANRLSGKRQHALEHGDADRQITVQIKECGEKIRWPYRDEFGNAQPFDRLKAIKANRNAI